MNHWKTKLIEAYRLFSSPYRRYRFDKMEKTGQVPVIVLFYHRVANSHMNSWTISRSQFKQQIDWLQDHFDVVDLAECQRRIASGHNTQPTVSITFDDGYAENCEFGLPLLIERKIPATYFVTTMHTTHQKPFQHDVEQNQPLPVNSIESLRALSLAGIEIGAHSRTHPDVGSITCTKQLIDEVISSTLELQKLVEQKIRYFAFPFGGVANLAPDAFALLKRAGLDGVCSAYGGWNEIGGDSFHLQRIHGDPSMSRLRNWLSFDPRISKTERYDYKDGKVDEDLLDQALKSIAELEASTAIPEPEYDEDEISDLDFSDTIAITNHDQK